MNSEYERSLVIGLEAEYPVRGSVLLPRDSSEYELEVRNATLLCELLIDK